MSPGSEKLKAIFFCQGMQWFPVMFCRAGPRSLGFFFLHDVKFSGIVIYRLKKTEATSTIENCIVTQSKLLISSPR